MAKLTIPAQIDGHFLDDLAVGLSYELATDPDVVLSNESMEGASSIGISDWTTVTQTIIDCLKTWFNDLVNKRTLSVPIPIPFYNYLYLVVERFIIDSKGTVGFKLGELAVGPLDTDNVFALFGAEGYYSKRFGSYTGAEYLSSGKRKQPKLRLTRENNLLSKEAPFSDKVVDLPVGRIPIFIQDPNTATNSAFVVSLDGFDPEFTSMCSILPPLEVATSELNRLSPRVSTVQNEELTAIAKNNVAPGLAAYWIVSHQKNVGMAIRAVLPYEVSPEIFGEMSRSLVIAERLVPYRELPAALPYLPKFDGAINIMLGSLAVSNPTLCDNMTVAAMNACSQQIRTMIAPSCLTESIRCHTIRFITNNVQKNFDGAILAFPLIHDLRLPSGHLVDIGGLRDDINEWRSVMELYSCLQPSPLLSKDYNKVPITVKYNVIAVSNSEIDNTGKNEQVKYPEYSRDSVSRILMRLPLSGQDTLAIKADLEEFGINMPNAVLDDIATNIFNYYQALENAGDEKPENPFSNLILPKEFTGEWKQLFVNDTRYPYASRSSDIKSAYFFTKFKEAALRSTAEKFSGVLHYPNLQEGTHRLVNLGYTKVSRIYLWPTLQVSSASVAVDNKPVTEYGKVLKGLARKGGFGFGQLLGPLLGTAGSAVGGLLGVPELGEITGLIGNLAGSAIPF